MRYWFFAVPALLSGIAWGQLSPVPPSGWMTSDGIYHPIPELIPSPNPLTYPTGDIAGPLASSPTGDDALDRARAICAAHSHVDDSRVIATNPPQSVIDYDKGYEAPCAKVEAAWAKSAAAKAERDRKTKEVADKKFLDDFAAGLK